MATNQIYDNTDSIVLPVAADTAAGKPVMVGDFCATTRTPEGEGVSVGDLEATCDLVGGYEQTVTGALTVGQKVYMTGTPSGGFLSAALTATATDNTHWGYAITAKGSGSGLAIVRPRKI